MFCSIISHTISLPSTIGLECESGNVDDCNSSMTMEILPDKCKGILVFSSNTERNCGTQCSVQPNTRQRKFKKKESVKRQGWTKWVRY